MRASSITNDPDCNSNLTFRCHALVHKIRWAIFPEFYSLFRVAIARVKEGLDDDTNLRIVATSTNTFAAAFPIVKPYALFVSGMAELYRNVKAVEHNEVCRRMEG